MNLNSKRRVDYVYGSFILYIFRVPTKVLGFLLSRDHSRLPVHTILISKFQGLGSLVIAKPTLRKLRVSFPNARIIFWGASSTCALAREMVEFDEVLELNDDTLMTACCSLFLNLLHIWKRTPDWVFDLEVYSRLSAVLTTLTCGRNRAGFAIDSVSDRRDSHTHLVYFNRYKYLGSAYQRLLELVISDDPSSDESLAFWKFELLRLPGLPKKYIVINPQAGDLALERRWPIEYFKWLISRLRIAYPDITVVLIGHGASEVSYLSQIESADGVLNLAGKLSLKETIRCLNFAELTVSNDTAPLHLALAGKGAVLGLFGPTNPASYMNLDRPGYGTVALSEELYCSPCVHHWIETPCGGDNQCMKSISPTLVLSWCIKLLAAHQSELITDRQREYGDLPLKSLAYQPGLVYERKFGIGK